MTPAHVPHARIQRDRILKAPTGHRSRGLQAPASRDGWLSMMDIRGLAAHTLPTRSNEHRMRASHRILCSLGLVVTLATAAGCASAPALPSDFDLHRTTVKTMADIEGPIAAGSLGKGKAGVVGALGGAGVGLVAGAIPCLALGPLMPACLGMLAPTVALTAGGTAAWLAAKADSSETIQAKQDMLRDAVTEADLQLQLTAALSRSLESPQTGALAQAPVSMAAEAPSPWTVHVGLTRLAALPGEADKPFGLSATGRMAIQRAEGKQESFSKYYFASSNAKHDLAGWQADNGAAVRLACDEMVSLLATEIASDLLR